MSIIIIFVSIALVFTIFSTTDSNVDMYNYNLEIITSLTQTEINSLNDEEIRDLFIQNKIRNIKNTVAQQISEFYYLGLEEDAKNLTEIFVKDYTFENMNCEIILINDSTNYLLFNNTVEGSVEFEESSISSVNRRSLIGFINSTDYYGPYIMEVKLWI
jgi:hypothetical protein